MSQFVKDMLMAKYGMQGDGRNPYGSRGGYVSSRRPRGDRGDMARMNRDMRMQDMRMGDMARGGRGNRGGRGRGDYGDMNRMAQDMRRNEYDMRGGDYNMQNNDYGDYNMRGDYGYDYGYDYGDDYGYDMRGGDYGVYAISGEYDGRMGDYARGRRNDYGYDMRRDYGEMKYGKMTEDDIEEWEHKLKNNDGTSGKHFSKEHCAQIAKQMGIDPSKLGGEKILCMAMNMMYSDHCTTAKKYNVDRPEFYLDFAKDFLMDKDYNGDGEQKLWTYYQCIVKE